MDSEKPSFRSRLGTRIVGAVIGVMLLYVLSDGPSAYVFQRFPKSQPLITALYEPLDEAAAGTPLEDILLDHENWWAALAFKHSKNDPVEVQSPVR